MQDSLPSPEKSKDNHLNKVLIAIIIVLLLLLSALVFRCCFSKNTASPHTQKNPPFATEKLQSDLLQCQTDKAKLVTVNQGLTDEVATLKQANLLRHEPDDPSGEAPWKKRRTELLTAQTHLKQQLDALFATQAERPSLPPQVSAECRQLADGLQQNWLDLDYLERRIRDVAAKEPVDLSPTESIEAQLRDPIRRLRATTRNLLPKAQVLSNDSARVHAPTPATARQPSNDKVRMALQLQQHALDRFLEVSQCTH